MASVQVFEGLTGEVEKESQQAKEVTEEPSKLFEEAISNDEISEEEEKQKKPVEPSKEIEARLDLLAKMYATNKDKYIEEVEQIKLAESEEQDVEQD